LFDFLDKFLIFVILCISTATIITNTFFFPNNSSNFGQLYVFAPRSLAWRRLVFQHTHKRSVLVA